MVLSIMDIWIMIYSSFWVGSREYSTISIFERKEFSYDEL